VKEDFSLMPQVASRTTEQQHSSTTCPDCNGDVTQSDWERYCQECGLVVDVYRVDYGPEWRSFDADARERVGAPRTQARHDRGLSTKIGRGVDARGNSLSSKKQRRLARQRRLHSQSQTRSKRERNQITGNSEIKRIAGHLELGDGLVEQACSLFETAQSDDLLVGRSIEAGASAAIFIICRMNHCPRQAETIVEPARCSVDDLWNMTGVLKRELSLPVPIQEPAGFVPEITADLEEQVPASMRLEAEQLATEVHESGTIQGKPSAIAAGCLYTVGRRDDHPRFTQRAIADAANVSAVSVRKYWQTIQNPE